LSAKQSACITSTSRKAPLQNSKLFAAAAKSGDQEQHIAFGKKLEFFFCKFNDF
jgi:hypothetical protein